MTKTHQDIRNLLESQSDDEMYCPCDSFEDSDDVSDLLCRQQSSHYYKPDLPVLLSDRYRVTEPIGHGRFSQVFLAQDILNNNIDVALKIYRTSSEFYEYFQNELCLYEHLENKSHPNVVSCLDTFIIETDEGSHGVMVLEKMQSTVARLIDHYEDNLPRKKVYQILYQVCDGLNFLHDNGIIHADIKPENLLIDENFQVKICDIGSGMLIDRVDSFHVGTVPYISPEVILGVPYDFKIDVWSVGALMFELLTGECLFDPDLYFESDTDTDIESEVSADESSSKDDRQDSVSGQYMRHSLRQTEAEDDDMQGYEWEVNHFQLCAFKAIVGRLPVDVFNRGHYFNMFYDRQGRLKTVPRCIDNRKISDILIEDFNQDSELAMTYQNEILSMLVLNPDERPSSRDMTKVLYKAYEDQPCENEKTTA